MTYKVATQTFKLKFDDGQYDGLEVKAKSCSTGDFLRIAKLAETFDPKERDFEQVNELFELFSGCLVAWNVEDDNGLVPPSLAGLLTLDLGMVLHLITSWMDAVAGVSGPKGDSSKNGQQTIPDLNLPRESL